MMVMFFALRLVWCKNRFSLSGYVKFSQVDTWVDIRAASVCRRRIDMAHG